MPPPCRRLQPVVIINGIMSKSDEKREKWVTWLALTTAVLAVLAAITTMYMGKFSTRTVLMQAQETDQWAYYQAKSIKGHTYEIQKQKIELELLQGKPAPAAREKIDKVLAKYDANIKRYDREKDEIKAKAEELAREKQTSQDRSANFSYSLIFLQIAIVLSSIAAITKRKPLWYLGLVVATGWIFYFLNAFYLFYQ